MSCFILVLSQANAAVKNEIDAATKSGNSIFLVVTDAGVNGTEKAMGIARKAQSMSSKSEVILMNRSEEDNKGLVSQFRLAGAPLPLILVIASNGVVAGGYLLKQATPELLVKAIPSPKKADIIKALTEGESVFIVVSSKNMTKKSNLINTCQTACAEMGNRAKIIEIDLNDPKEKSFLAELEIDPKISEPTTYVINSKGQLTGRFDSNVSSATLTASAKKVVSSCCAPGSGKSCK